MDRRPPVRLLLACLVACSLAPAGCGPSDGLTAVSGTVTVDGAAPESGRLSLFPAAGAGNPVGAEIVNGEYSLRAPPGNSRVEIRVSKVVGEQRIFDDPDAPVKQVKAEALPAKYNDRSELTVEISEDGDNVHNFDLTTGGS